MKLLPLVAIFLCLLCHNGFSQKVADIRLNQVGFYPNSPKLAVVVGDKRSQFVVKDLAKNKVVFKGELGATRTSQHSGRKTMIADFSKFSEPGKYKIEVPALQQSGTFEIKENIYKAVATAALKGFYYQRASTALPEKYAGKWAREGGHADDRVLIHASAVSDERPENHFISSKGGWYDAGDYNKYIVNSGITLGTLLSLYEDYPAYFETFNTNIPESNDAIPDLLDEVIWNLRWMLTMQDPADGGVYHKLTNPQFDGTVMPAAATKPRFVVQKSTAATLDFVAVMAQSARVLRAFDNKLPGLADSCTRAALNGWKWSKSNPAELYNQDANNKKYEPKIVTGAYGDKDVSDEWIWAAAEMYSLTGKEEYLNGIDLQLGNSFVLPTWNQVRALGYYTILRSGEALKPPGNLVEDVKKNLLSYTTTLLADLDKQPYHTVMGKSPRDYAWGSSSVAANQGIALLYAYKVSKNTAFIEAALGNMDYLLGRNATGYSFLTGFGTKQVMHPHHRISDADGVNEPVPGLLSGGPNPGQQDKCTTYPNKFADESFTDHYCSYASNEIAINWNSPMVYLAAALDAQMTAKP